MKSWNVHTEVLAGSSWSILRARRVHTAQRWEGAGPPRSLAPHLRSPARRQPLPGTHCLKAAARPRLWHRHRHRHLGHRLCRQVPQRRSHRHRSQPHSAELGAARVQVLHRRCREPVSVRAERSVWFHPRSRHGRQYQRLEASLHSSLRGPEARRVDQNAEVQNDSLIRQQYCQQHTVHPTSLEAPQWGEQEVRQVPEWGPEPKAAAIDSSFDPVSSFASEASLEEPHTIKPLSQESQTLLSEDSNTTANPQESETSTDELVLDYRLPAKHSSRHSKRSHQSQWKRRNASESSATGDSYWFAVISNTQSSSAGSTAEEEPEQRKFAKPSVSQTSVKYANPLKLYVKPSSVPLCP